MHLDPGRIWITCHCSEIHGDIARINYAHISNCRCTAISRCPCSVRNPLNFKFCSRICRPDTDVSVRNSHHSARVSRSSRTQCNASVVSGFDGSVSSGERKVSKISRIKTKASQPSACRIFKVIRICVSNLDVTRYFQFFSRGSCPDPNVASIRIQGKWSGIL